MLAVDGSEASGPKFNTFAKVAPPDSVTGTVVVAPLAVTEAKVSLAEAEIVGL